jgi:RNA polymerase sigma factor (sigma-70 family)
MRPRQNLVELFSTFLQFDQDRVRSWLTDARLKRSMQIQFQASESNPALQAEASENFWALYWHKHWQTQSTSLARAHLSAYVQEPCYWAAHKTTTGFVSTQYSLADCFQMAIAGLDKVLKGFNASQGFNFKNYASATFGSLIRETLRQRQEVDICTDWALLRKLSQKRLVESLQNSGLPADAIAAYVLAWTCFKTVYVPTQASGTRKLPKPTPEIWMAIAKLYNGDRHAQLTATAPSANPDQLEKWLLTCAKAARAYLYPTAISINTPKPGQESGEFLDDLPQVAQTSLLQDMIADEDIQTRQTQQAQIGNVLANALKKLSPDLRTILELYYAQNLTQQEMAAQLDTKQYTVSRRLTKARELLLTELMNWSQETLHITPSLDVLKHTSMALEEWLKTHYHPSNLPASAE